MKLRFALTLSGLVSAALASPAAASDPFRGRRMWIWVMSSSNGGDLGLIIAARRDELRGAPGRDSPSHH